MKRDETSKDDEMQDELDDAALGKFANLMKRVRKGQEEEV